MELYFYPSNCTTTNPESTPEAVSAEANEMGFVYDAETGLLSYRPPLEYYMNIIIKIVLDGENEIIAQHVSFWPEGKTFEKQLTEEQRLAATGFEIQIGDKTGYWSYATAFVKAQVIGDFVYPTGAIDIKNIPVSLVGFSGQKEGYDFSHVQIIVAEILGDGAVGGAGHVWESPFYSKDVDTVVSLENIIGFCEGQDMTAFNVSFHMVAENETGGFDFVRAHIVGGATTETTFSVQSVEAPLVSLGVDGVCSCLDPVLLTVNRHENRDIQFVRVEVGNYIADFEFNADRNLLEIDIAEYLQTLFALVDLFEFQQMQATVVVKLYNSAWKHLQTQGRTITAVYGMKPESEIPDNLRVQWLDKFGALHDVMFKVFQNVAEGDSKQKYVSKGIEHEEKNGERSLSLAYVNANASQRIALETIVFADHVRAYFNGNWKRVKVANTYKNGTGREKRNFEITIKYAI